MTKAFDRRVSALERGQGLSLSPKAMAWLGWPLTDEEAAIASRTADSDFSATDTSNWSKELKAWLGGD